MSIRCLSIVTTIMVSVCASCVQVATSTGRGRPEVAATDTETPTAGAAVRFVDPMRDEPSTPERIAALLSQHVDPSAPPELGADGLVVPTDWKVLPQSAVTWALRGSSEELFLAGRETVITRHYTSYVAVDLRTGDERWSRRTPSYPSPRSEAVAACDGIVVFFLPESIVGIDARDGHELWSERTRPSRTSDHREFATSGCTVGFFRAHRSTALADEGGSADFWTLDARTGRATRRSRCSGYCAFVEATDTHLLMTDYDDGTTVVVRASGEMLRRDDAVHFVDRGPDAIVVELPDEGGVRGVSLDGHVVWSRKRRFGIRARFGNDVIVRDEASIRRLSLLDGATAWSVPLGHEMTNLLQDGDTWVADADRVVVANRHMPSLIVVVDFATGRVEAVRLAPEDPVRILLSGERLVLGAHDAVVGIDLSHEAPPIRSVLTLEEDVRRSAEELVRAEREAVDRRFANVPTYAYPLGHEAIAWLRRLGPLAAPTLRSMLVDASIEDAASLVPAVGLDESAESQAQVTATLRRTYAMPPTADLTRLRVATLRALRPSLPPDVATELVTQTVEWLEFLREEGWLSADAIGRCEADPPGCELAQGTYAAVRSAHAALERTSEDPAPIEALRRAVRTGVATAPSSCQPSETDLVLNAALTHEFLFDALDSGHVIVPEGSCVELVTAAGRVTLDDGPGPHAAPFVSLSAPVQVSVSGNPSDSDPTWSQAPTYTVTIVWDGGPLRAQGGVFTVKKVGGMWRVVEYASTWVS